MKASELRIGNIVINHNGDIIEVKLICEDFIQSKDRSYSYGNIFGIPLTEKWLLKFGFASDIKKEWWFNGGVTIGFITTDSNYEFEYDAKKLPTQLKYVHQLQNLYFALTGEELTINEDIVA